MATLFPGLAAAQVVTVTIGVGDTILSVSGQTSPGAFVTISKNGSTIGTTTAAADGSYGVTIPAQEPGIHTYRLAAQTPGGQNTNPVDVNVNITEHATTNLYVFLPPTLQIATLSPAYGQPVAVSGETAPDVDVMVYMDNVIYATVQADGQGRWSAVISTASLAGGNHQLFARAVDGLGEQSYPTAVRTIVVAAEPSRPIERPSSGGQGGTRQAPPKPVITYPPTGLEWPHPTITIRGTAQSGTQVEVWDGDKIIGSVWADDKGDWQLPLHLGKAEYDLRARACRAERCSGFSPSVRFRYTPPPGQQRPLTVIVPQSQFSILRHQQLTIRATIMDGRAPYTVVASWGDGTRTRAATGSQYIFQKHKYQRTGRYVVQLQLEDAAGRTNTIYYTVEVRPGLGWAIPLGMVLVAASLAAAFWLLWKRWHRLRGQARAAGTVTRKVRKTKR
jgi:hypothetical protein